MSINPTDFLVDHSKSLEELEEDLSRLFEVDKAKKWLTLHICGEYAIELKRIPDPEALVHWLSHLTEKGWFEGKHVHEFIATVYWAKGWDLYRRSL